MITTLEAVENLKIELDSLRPLNAEAEKRVMQKFRLDWNYHSNHLEGTQLTYGETKALLLFGITAQGKPLKDHLEITGHNEAIELVNEVVKDEYPLNESFIRQLHTLLLKEPYYVDAVTSAGQPTRRLIKIGEYKSHPNHVLTQTGETFFFATPEETPPKMSDLIEWYREKKEEKDVNPIILAAEFHYKFIRIHPFDDGNGRLARILMNFILMQFGYPPVIIKTEDKNNYLSVLQQADAGIFEPFVEYIATNLQRSLEIIIKGARGESIEESDDLDKELALLEQKIKVVGQGFKVERSKEVLVNLFDKSLKPLIDDFFSVSEKFDKFYTSIRKSLKLNSYRVRDFSNYPFLIRSQFTDESTELVFNYVYKSFKQSGFDGFNFFSGFTIKFNLTTYSITSSFGFPKISLEKSYAEQFSEEEKKEVIGATAEKHKEFIEKELRKVQS